MRRGVQALAGALIWALVLAGCGSAASTPKYFINRTTDYIKFMGYPSEGVHTNDIGKRQLVSDGFSFVLDTHAELDFSVGSDQLDKMTASLGEPLSEAYRWRLENNEYYEAVELAESGMEKVADQPAYHAKYHFNDSKTSGGIAKTAEFYALAYDSSLCTLIFVYADGDDKTGAEKVAQILKGTAISDGYVAPQDYGFSWQADYTPIHYDYQQGKLADANGSRVRVDGKIINGYEFGGSAFLQVFDSYGYYWELEMPENTMNTLLDRLTGALELEEPYGVPVSVFGTLVGTESTVNNPLETGPLFHMDADYLITSQDQSVYEFDDFSTQT